ncbi:MAG: alpha/beta fold hydrolase [Alphaproteobacteria bacterium]
MNDSSPPRVSPVPARSGSGPLAAWKGERPPAPAWFEAAVNTPHESRFVEVEGASIHYLRWGERHRPGLLLCHGNAAHANWWSFIAPFLAREYNVAALSFSGMGDSSWRESYSMETFAAEQMAVMEDAGMFAPAEPPVILAHSFGGFVTILAAALYGARLAGAVIADSPVNPPEPQSRGGPRRSVRPHKVYRTLKEALARFRLMPEQACENDFLLDYIARHSLRPMEGGWSWKFDPSIWRRFSIGDTASRMRAITCRFAIFYGEGSAIFPRETGRYMYHLLGRTVPVVEIPQARHHVMLDQPLAFVAALRTLLADWNHSLPLPGPPAAPGAPGAG